jgi:hypothetical protein
MTNGLSAHCIHRKRTRLHLITKDRVELQGCPEALRPAITAIELSSAAHLSRMKNSCGRPRGGWLGRCSGTRAVVDCISFCKRG